LAELRAQTQKDRNLSAAVELLSGLSDAQDVQQGLLWLAHPSTDAGDAIAQLGRALLARRNSEEVAQRVLTSVRSRAQADGQQRVVARADFVLAASQAPLRGPGARSAVLQAGVKRLAEGPAADETGLAQLASAMSQATDNFSDKARLARTAMWQI